VIEVPLEALAGHGEHELRIRDPRGLDEFELACDVGFTVRVLAVKAECAAHDAG
jgi:hypothetical protein